jgi:hypothetical protein
VESSFERQIEEFTTVYKHRGKLPRRHRKALISPSKRLVWGTELAILAFVSLVILQGLSIIYLGEFRGELMSALFMVLSFIAGTYWGHRG